MLLQRIASEIVELRALLFNIHRDSKKSGPIHGYQLAPDLFETPEQRTEQDEMDMIGESLMSAFGGFGSG